MKKTPIVALGCLVTVFWFSGSAFGAEGACITCHRDISPGQVADWEASKHSQEDVTCSTCHGEKHKKVEDANLAELPDESLCAECHEEQFNQFAKGKHNLG